MDTLPPDLFRLVVFFDILAASVFAVSAAIRKHCEPGDLDCRRRQRQALLHWAYDSRRL